MLSSHCSCRNKSHQSLTTPPPPPPPPAPRPSNLQRTMEEVWKDINLASLDDHNTLLTDANNPNLGNIILQDFLARPFTRETQTPSIVSSPSHSPVPSQPATVLSLSSGREFHRQFDSLTNGNSQFLQSLSNGSSFNSASFENLACASSSLPSFGNNKRFAESDSSPEDRRHKRMIKNRESAARSRARKQAYTNELEREVKHLAEENAKLRRLQEELLKAAASQKKKHSLSRTSTAPF